MNENVILNEFCLACGSKNLIETLNLRFQPLANSYLSSLDEKENTYPLNVNLCKYCYHLQLSHIVNPHLIYKNYLYVSGTSKTLKDYSNWFAGYVDETIKRNTYNILDIGCNDGTQLDSFKDLGYNTYGIDPARNIYETSSKKHSVICDYFGMDVLDKLNVNFDAITAQNVFAHNPKPLNFLQICEKLMNDNTLLFIQTSQADMVINNEFDTIYHEHINFFNINSMNMLTKRAGLNLIDAFKTPIHGTSYVFVISKTKNRDFYIENLIKQESKLLINKTYIDWEQNIQKNMKELHDCLHSYKEEGFKLIGYGAAAKGNTLLNFANIKLDYIIDDNPLKQNLYTPGTHTLIVSINLLANLGTFDKVVFIPLAWNFFNEISLKIKKHRNNSNDVYIKYFPKVEINYV